MRIRPVVASTIMAARPWGLPQTSMTLEIGSFNTPLRIDETSSMVGMRECEANSLVT
jgi:hypothetical protein